MTNIGRGQGAQTASELRARIKIDTDRRIGEIDPKTKTLLVNVVNRHRESLPQTEIFSHTGRFPDKGIAFEVDGSDSKSEYSAVEQKVKIDGKLDFVLLVSSELLKLYPVLALRPELQAYGTTAVPQGCILMT